MSLRTWLSIDRSGRLLVAAMALASVTCAQGEQAAEQDKAAIPPAAANATPEDGIANLPEDLRKLIGMVDAAHRKSDDAPRDVRSFRAEIRVEPRKKGENAVAFDLRVDFQMPRAIRYEVMEEGQRKERGFDPKRGPWVRTGDRVTAVQGREHNLEREQVLREIRLARQLLAFLDPQQLLGGLQQPQPVTKEDLRIMRLRYPDCPTIRGHLPSFPTYSIGHDGPCQVCFYIDPDSHRLLAVRATPLDPEGRPATVSELLTLGGYTLAKDLWLPTELTVYRVEHEVPSPQTQIDIRRLDLTRTFAADHFDRPM